MKFGSGSVKTDDFDYYLPEELIAQTPLEKRDDSKLMILDKKTGEIKHEVFSNIINYLNEDDILVLNDTKVLPARIKDLIKCIYKPVSTYLGEEIPIESDGNISNDK